MINLFLNGAPIVMSQNCYLDAALVQWGMTDQLFAVAINHSFVPKQHYATTLLSEGDRVDIVTAMQGG